MPITPSTHAFDDLVGADGNAVNPIFLNLMAAMTDRVGKVLVRVGGNSQEQATVVPEGLPNGQAILKPQVGASRVCSLCITESDILVNLLVRHSRLCFSFPRISSIRWGTSLIYCLVYIGLWVSGNII
jgi:hypothetical protein